MSAGLLKTAKEFVDHTASLYTGVVSKDKVYSHYALYPKGFTSGLPYERRRRNPAHLAKQQSIAPGFSIYLCDQGGCHGDLKSVIGGRAWAVTKTNPALAPALIDGFPGKGVIKPRFVVAYNFSSVELAKPSAINHLKQALWGSGASGGGAYVGTFSAGGSYYYSNGAVYCRIKDGCLTQPAASVPDKPGLLSKLTDGGMCESNGTCGSSNYVGTFSAGGSYYYSNGSVYCRIKDGCLTQPAASVPDKPGLLSKLTNGGMCESNGTCGSSNYVGIFSAGGSYYYSNGSVYCRYKDATTMTCTTGQSVATVPSKPGLLSALNDGGACQVTVKESNYVGVFSVKGSYYSSNGSVYCRIKDAAAVTCGGQSLASVPEKPCQLIKLQNGGPCQPTPGC